MYNSGCTCSENCPSVCACGPVMIGLFGGLGRSGRHCLLLIALCGLEMYCLCWYLLLLHGGGPEMSVFLMCCLVGAGDVGNRGVLWVGCGCV